MFQCIQDHVVQDKGGVQLPNAMNMTVAPSAKKEREAQWRLAWPVMKATLQSGEDVLVHCVAGKHRAAGVSVLARSLLAKESLEEAEAAISQVREIDAVCQSLRLHSCEKKISTMSGSFVHRTQGRSRVR